jgi:hypothetical protein
MNATGCLNTILQVAHHTVSSTILFCFTETPSMFARFVMSETKVHTYENLEAEIIVLCILIFTFLGKR